jgi:hypothetical protein
MIALPIYAAPTAADLAMISALCDQLLEMTSHPALQTLWCGKRRGARQILRACRRPGYFETADCAWDVDRIDARAAITATRCRSAPASRR